MKRDAMTMHAQHKAYKEIDWHQLDELYKKIMPAKTKAPVTFRIKRSPKTKQFRCVVQAGNGEVILTGEPCKNRKDVRKMVASVYEAFASGAVTMIDDADAAGFTSKVRGFPAPKKLAKKKPRLDNVVISKWP